MAKFNGTEFKAYIVGTPNKLIKGTTGLDITVSVAEIDVSTKDSLGWKEIIGGQKSWSASFTGIVDYTEGSDEAGIKALLALEIARTPVTLLFSNGITASQTYTGTGLVLNIDWGAPLEDKVEFTVEIGGSAAITLATLSE